MAEDVVLLTTEDVRALLGVRRPRIYQLVAEGRLEVAKREPEPPHRMLFTQAAVDRCLALRKPSRWDWERGPISTHPPYTRVVA